MSKITMAVVSVHKLSHYIKCCRGNSGLVGCATHLELRQTSTKPLLKATAVHCKQLNGKKLLHPCCRLALNPLTIVIFSYSDFLFVMIKSHLDITLHVYTSQRNQLA